MTTPGGSVAEAIVVRVVEFAETSQVVHLVTARHGHVSAIAKGAHGARGAFQGGVPLAVLGEAHLVPRRGSEMELLRSFRVIDGLRGLRDDLVRYDAGCAILGLLRHLSKPGLANEPLFLAAVSTLKALAASPPAAAPTWLLVFEARALASTGHRPHLASCVACGGTLARDIVFDPGAGGAAHRGCASDAPVRALSPADRATLERLYTSRLPEFASEPLGPAQVRAVRAVHDLFLPYAYERAPARVR
jgi:DNA repair protein RecO (recombination protein O)